MEAAIHQLNSDAAYAEPTSAAYDLLTSHHGTIWATRSLDPRPPHIRYMFSDRHHMVTQMSTVKDTYRTEKITPWSKRWWPDLPEEYERVQVSRRTIAAIQPTMAGRDASRQRSVVLPNFLVIPAERRDFVIGFIVHASARSVNRQTDEPLLSTSTNSSASFMPRPH